MLTAQDKFQSHTCLESVTARFCCCDPFDSVTAITVSEFDPINQSWTHTMLVNTG